MTLTEFVKSNRDIINSPDFFSNCTDYLRYANLLSYEKAWLVLSAAILKGEPIGYMVNGHHDVILTIRDHYIWTILDSNKELKTERDLAFTIADIFYWKDPNMNSYADRIWKLLRKHSNV